MRTCRNSLPLPVYDLMESTRQEKRKTAISSRLGTLERLSPVSAPGPERAEQREIQYSATVIVPALNEADAIGRVVGDLVARYPEYEILVVDDGSTDNTGELAASAGARVIRHEWNKGYGASLRTGCRLAKGEIIVCFDGDGQHNPDDVKRLVDEIGPHDMVVGTRSRDSHEPLVRRPGKFILATFANFLAGVKIPDVNSGFRAFKRDVILRYLHLMPTGFSFSTTSTFAMLKSGRPVKWVPIKVKKRIGTSSVSQVRHGLQTLLLMVRLTTLFEPLKVFLPVSAIVLARGDRIPDRQSRRRAERAADLGHHVRLQRHGLSHGAGDGPGGRASPGETRMSEAFVMGRRYETKSLHGRGVRAFWDSVADKYVHESESLEETHFQRFERAFAHFQPAEGMRALNIWSRNGEAIDYFRRLARPDLRTRQCRSLAAIDRQGPRPLSGRDFCRNRSIVACRFPMTSSTSSFPWRRSSTRPIRWDFCRSLPACSSRAEDWC